MQEDQSADVGAASANSVSSLNEDADREAKIQALEKGLQKEERVQDAIMKMISAADAKRKPDLQRQLQGCQKNIQSIKMELEAAKSVSSLWLPLR